MTPDELDDLLTDHDDEQRDELDDLLTDHDTVTDDELDDLLNQDYGADLDDLLTELEEAKERDAERLDDLLD